MKQKLKNKNKNLINFISIKLIKNKIYLKNNIFSRKKNFGKNIQPVKCKFKCSASTTNKKTTKTIQLTSNSNINKIEIYILYIIK